MIKLVAANMTVQNRTRVTVTARTTEMAHSSMMGLTQGGRQAVCCS